MNWWWYLTRSTGIVATVLIFASLVWGFLFSARETGKRLRAAWWLDLHNWLGGLGLAFSVAHVVAVLLDKDSGFDFVQALVPGKIPDDTLPIGFGIVALYAFVVVVFTSWPKLRFKRKIWRMIHLLSVPAALLAGLHAYQSGSDKEAFAFRLLLVVLTAIVVYPASLRLLGAIAKKRAKA